MDICAATARTRTLLGDYAGAVAAADLADSLVAGGDQRWVAWPARTRIEAYYYWDRWDDALAAHERFVEVFRRGQRIRYLNVPALVAAVATAIHLLRGDRERADVLEQRVGRVPPQFDLIVGHALLGACEPELAIERVERVRIARHWALAITAEGQAALGRWADLEATLAELDGMEGVDQLPRLVAQTRRRSSVRSWASTAWAAGSSTPAVWSWPAAPRRRDASTSCSAPSRRSAGASAAAVPGR